MLSEQTPATSEHVHLLNRMGMRDVVENDECLIIEMDNRPDLTNIRGGLQGGLVATLIDIAAGRLAGRRVGPAQDVTTADMNVHLLAPIVEGPARAVATVVRAGKRMSPMLAAHNAARATLSFAVLDRR